MGHSETTEYFGGSIAVSGALEDGRPTVVAFGGLHQQIGMPPFEFFRLLSTWSINKVFVRDLHRSFYQRRVVPGDGPSLTDLAAALESLLPVDSKRLLVGTSAGGYAALGVGSITTSRVLAVAPVTTLRMSSRIRMLDKRWRRPMYNASRASRAWRDQRDLLSIMASYPKFDAHVYYPSGNRLDKAHAFRLRPLPGVVLHRVESQRHEVIREMRETGQLAQVMNDLLCVDPPIEN